MRHHRNSQVGTLVSLIQRIMGGRKSGSTGFDHGFARESRTAPLPAPSIVASSRITNAWLLLSAALPWSCTRAAADRWRVICRDSASSFRAHAANDTHPQGAETDTSVPAVGTP